MNKKIIIIIIVVVAIVLGVLWITKTEAPKNEIPKETEEIIPSHETEEVEEIPEAAIILLSFVAEKEGVNLNEIELIDVLDQEWPDGCLGLAAPDEFCTQAIVPGYEIEIIVSGEWQVFRTNMDASVIRQAE